MGPENIPYKGGILHADAMEVLSKTKARVLLPTVVTYKKKDITRWKHHKGPIPTRYMVSSTSKYWGRVHRLGLTLCSAGRERDIIIYVWKILEGLAPKVGRETKNPRRGRLFSHNGVRLFNCAPRHIRDPTGVTTDTFKHHLDKGWLTSQTNTPARCRAARPSLRPARKPFSMLLPFNPLGLPKFGR
ncbi:hypothetical protein GWK47_039112 [Chionoecetes opilio]|uniref:Uncharacterized protein n=1 Tax=Chionoecetes opilio TaxID=41210 RepID=A0A8J4YEL8_CHIOP|nr:hypothetical protein GWK47_039112 [Chionoecetes opilio]